MAWERNEEDCTGWHSLYALGVLVASFAGVTALITFITRGIGRATALLVIAWAAYRIARIGAEQVERVHKERE